MQIVLPGRGIKAVLAQCVLNEAHGAYSRASVHRYTSYGCFLPKTCVPTVNVAPLLQ